MLYTHFPSNVAMVLVLVMILSWKFIFLVVTFCFIILIFCIIVKIILFSHPAYLLLKVKTPKSEPKQTVFNRPGSLSGRVTVINKWTYYLISF